MYLGRNVNQLTAVDNSATLISVAYTNELHKLVLLIIRIINSVNDDGDDDDDRPHIDRVEWCLIHDKAS